MIAVAVQEERLRRRILGRQVVIFGAVATVLAVTRHPGFPYAVLLTLRPADHAPVDTLVPADWAPLIVGRRGQMPINEGPLGELIASGTVLPPNVTGPVPLSQPNAQGPRPANSGPNSATRNAGDPLNTAALVKPFQV